MDVLLQQSGPGRCCDRCWPNWSPRDVVLITTPMYDFSVPASLKAWIDQVTFPRMSLAGRRFVIASARGGACGPGTPREPYDHQERYLRDFLTRPLPTLVCAVLVIGAVYLLARAMEGLPVGTAYAVFTGIGAIGAIALGVLVHHDPMSPGRLAGLPDRRRCGPGTDDDTVRVTGGCPPPRVRRGRRALRLSGSRSRPPSVLRIQGLRLLTTSAVAARPSWIVGAMLVPARKNPSMAQTSACEIFSPPLRRKITARISRSSTSEIEMAMANLLRRAGMRHLAASVA